MREDVKVDYGVDAVESDNRYEYQCLGVGWCQYRSPGENAPQIHSFQRGFFFLPIGQLALIRLR